MSSQQININTKQQVQNNNIQAKVKQQSPPSVQNQRNIQIKKSLKQQAKQLLLKGCYLMAATKYTKLIDLDIKQLPSRQQAIIYLNCGICFQFMSEGNKKNFIQALNYMKKALSVDNTYQKTYYRLIQLLRDHGYYETALSLVPQSIKNKQIDLLLNQVRQLYLKQSDFTKMLQKFKTRQVTSDNVKMLCLKVEQTVLLFMQNHPNYIKQCSNQQIKTSIQKLQEQICLFYVLIGNYEGKKLKQSQNSEDRQSIMNQFSIFLSKLLGCYRLENANKMILIDSLTQSSLKYYRGQLNKFLSNKVKLKNEDLHLSSFSMFLSNNQFIKTTKRTVFFTSELKLIKYIRLIDINIQLFAKTLTYLSQQAYQTLKNSIKGQNLVQTSVQIVYDNMLIHQFLFSNAINPEQVIIIGFNPQIPYTNLTLRNGGHPQHLFKYITHQELNFMKQILLQECQKFASIYESSIIHPVWLQHLHEIMFTINNLLSIILNMIKIYSARQSKNVETFINQITEVSNLSHLIYIQHWELYSENQRQKLEAQGNVNLNKQKINIPSYGFKYSYQKLVNYFQSQNDNFIALLLMQRILQYIQKPSLSNQTESKLVQQNKLSYKQRIIQICIKKLQYTRTKISQTSNLNTQVNYIYKQMYLILVCIILKLDIKRSLQIDQKMVIKQIYKDFVSEIALQALLLILINKPSYVNYYLESQKDVTKLMKHFLSKPLLQKIEPFKILLNVIYILICDFQNDQELYFAKKLGVTPQEVHQVRKLQKETLNENQKLTTITLKKKFKLQVSSQWLQILNQLCRLVRVTLKMEPFCSAKLCKIIYSIAEVNHSKLYSTQIIQFMLQARNVKESGLFQFNIKETACKFFQIVCKKCNAQIFEYKHLQSIVDSLIWLISNCQHQLTYFQSLLGLVNLSTMSVRIPIQQIQKCLYEENSYIVHCGVCVMNNILIYNEELLEDEQKSKKVKNRISDLVCKYIEFYRDQIVTLQSQLPQSDYSHPKKIYNSLISLATVLKLDKLEQLQSWDKGKKYIKILANNQAPQLMFKLAIYHSLEEKLPHNWQIGLEEEMEMLRKNQPQKYSKLAQLI